MKPQTHIASLRAPLIFSWMVSLLIVTSPARAAITVVDYYRMGEGEGALGSASTFQDSVGGKTLTTSGSPFRQNVVSAEAAARVGSSVSMWNFGVTYATATLLSTVTNNFGIEMWVRPGGVTGNRCLAYNGSVDTNGYGLYQVGATFQGRIGATFFGNGTAAAGSWTHLALVRSSGTTTLYVNGVASGTTNTAPVLPTGSFGVAAAPPAMTADRLPVNSYLDEVRFFTFTSGQFTPNDLLWFTPDITLQQPVGNSLATNDTVDFGSVSVGTNTSLTFTITNECAVGLNGIVVTIGGADAGRFTITASPPSTVAVGASKTFTVRFTPTTSGNRTATLHVASNDPDENPFDILLTGTSPLRPEISVTPLVNGAVLAWGNGPIVPNGLSNIQAVASGVRHVMALKSDGSIAAWGVNTSGETIIPAGLTNIQSIAGGYQFSMALRSNGTVVAWGNNINGQTNVPVGLTNIQSITAGQYHSVALRKDGRVFAWGGNNVGQTNVPAGLTNALAISAGLNHTLVLRSNGTVVAWGENTDGQTNIPPGLTNVMAIAAGGYHSVAVRSNGTVVAWGQNFNGQTNVPAGLTNVMAIAAGTRHTVALLSDSTVVAWGNNASGQINVPDELSKVRAVTAGLDESVVLKDSYQSFGNQLVGTSSAAMTFTIKNTGVDPLSISNVSVSGDNASEFSVNTNGMLTSVPATSGQTTFTVTFTPGAAGGRLTTLRVQNNDIDESTFDITLAGTGTAPDIGVSQPDGTPIADGASKDFGSVNVRAETNLVFSITNSGDADLSIQGITIDGTNAAQFSVTVNPAASLTPGASTTFTVRFAPTSAGAKSATLHLTSNDSDESPYDITLLGTGVLAPEIAVFNGISTAAGNALTDNTGTNVFAPTALGSSFTQTFTITNAGTLALTGLALTKSGPNTNDFVLGALGTTTLAPDTATTFTVTFSPPVLGLRRAVVAIASNDGDENPFEINVSGAGVFTNADLSVLLPSPGTLSPAFSPGTTNYTVYVAPYVTNITFNLVAAQANASIQIRINGGAYSSVVSGDSSAGLALNPGTTNTVDIRVTAQDGTTIKIYTIAISYRPTGPGDVNLGYHPGPNNYVHTMAVQPDGKILIGGDFTSVGGIAISNIARLYADGTLDTNFNAGANDYVHSIVVQPDGKILVGGYFTWIAGVPASFGARLNADGTYDGSFYPQPNGEVHGYLVQADGKILLWGDFTFAGTPNVGRNHIARLNANSTMDTNFNPNVNDTVFTVAEQTGGKLLLGGSFTTLNPNGTNSVTRRRIARLNANGTLDTSFDSNTQVTNSEAVVRSIVVQADGKILVGGEFSEIAGQTRLNLARLQTNGTLDATFTPAVDNSVHSIAMQADGKIIVAGDFTTLDGQPRNHIARVLADGTLDADFNPDADNSIYGLCLQANGQIVIGGAFTSVGGVSNSCLARLDNDASTQGLTVSGSNRVEWLRGGTSPEAQLATFALSTNGGTSYTSLGIGTRIANGWELTGLNLPTSGLLRVRASTCSGEYNGSSSILETVITFNQTVPAIDSQSLIQLGNGAFRFSLTNPGNAVYSVIASTNLSLPLTNWNLLGTASNIGGGIYQFTDPAAGGSSRRFYLLRFP